MQGLTCWSGTLFSFRANQLFFHWLTPNVLVVLNNKEIVRAWTFFHSRYVENNNVHERKLSQSRKWSDRFVLLRGTKITALSPPSSRDHLSRSYSMQIFVWHGCFRSSSAVSICLTPLLTRSAIEVNVCRLWGHVLLLMGFVRQVYATAGMTTLAIAVYNRENFPSPGKQSRRV